MAEILISEKATNSSAKLSPADDDNEDAAVLDLIRKRKKLRSAFGDFGDKVRISEIMEAPNIAQEENKKLRATLEDLTRRPNIVEEEDKKLREAASSAASAMAGSQHDASPKVSIPYRNRTRNEPLQANFNLGRVLGCLFARLRFTNRYCVTRCTRAQAHTKWDLFMCVCLCGFWWHRVNFV